MHAYSRQTIAATLNAATFLTLAIATLAASQPARAALLGSSPAMPGISAKHILDAGHSLGDGSYWIDPDGPGGNAPFLAYADMTTAGGGWTLMTYAGTITVNKDTTVGPVDSAQNWFPVFNNFGTYDANSFSSGTPFSHRDMVDPLFQDSSEILAYRSNNLNNQMIFPVASRTSWLGGILPAISSLTLTNDGTNYVTHTTGLAVFNQGPLPRYTGYDWNNFTNADGVGSYATGLNHRSLIYWEPLDFPSNVGQTQYANMWFHAQPLSLTASTGPFNTIQNIAFLLREDVDYPLFVGVPEPSTLLLLGLGVCGMVCHSRRRRGWLGSVSAISQPARG